MCPGASRDHQHRSQRASAIAPRVTSAHAHAHSNACTYRLNTGARRSGNSCTYRHNTGARRSGNSCADRHNTGARHNHDAGPCVGDAIVVLSDVVDRDPEPATGAEHRAAGAGPSAGLDHRRRDRGAAFCRPLGVMIFASAVRTNVAGIDFMSLIFMLDELGSVWTCVINSRMTASGYHKCCVATSVVEATRLCSVDQVLLLIAVKWCIFAPVAFTSRVLMLALLIAVWPASDR